MKGFTLWFTGLSGAGKSTLAREIENILLERGMNVEVLDGDEVREHLSKGLGFSKDDRDTNVRRIGYVCKLLSRNGVVAITAAISPYRETRDAVREEIGRFVEVFCKCDLDTLKARDPKGLYEKALAGDIPNFTGVSDPYEEPDSAEVVVDTAADDMDACARRIVLTLEKMKYIPAVEEAGYSTDEEKEITKRLEDLGYI